MSIKVGKRTAEYVIYILFWGMLLLSPFFGDILNGESVSFDTHNLFAFWLYLLPAAILFVLNNNILMPFLLYKKRGRFYLLYLLCLLVACCLVYLFSPGVDKGPVHRRPGFEKVQPAGMPGSAESGAYFREYGPGAERYEPHETRGKEMRPRPPKGPDNRLLFAVSNPQSVQVLIAVLVLVFNICVRLSFFTLRRDDRIKELEKEMLKTELNYLKYQINPHFFMNTLNNIHALIDIDRDRAQAAVQELSKMMRYVLYDASTSLVPLVKEVVFLNSYIGLMRLRYISRLEVNACFPCDCEGVYIPSLLLVIFVENAFKHGVTYKKKSVIDIKLNVDAERDEVVFCCSNTCSAGAGEPETAAPGGIGVENARKRLALLFGDKASLEIDNDGNSYNVVLKMPVCYDKVYDN